MEQNIVLGCFPLYSMLGCPGSKRCVPWVVARVSLSVSVHKTKRHARWNWKLAMRGESTVSRKGRKDRVVCGLPSAAHVWALKLPRHHAALALPAVRVTRFLFIFCTAPVCMGSKKCFLNWDKSTAIIDIPLCYSLSRACSYKSRKEFDPQSLNNYWTGRNLIQL